MITVSLTDKQQHILTVLLQARISDVMFSLLPYYDDPSALPDHRSHLSDLYEIFVLLTAAFSDSTPD